MKSFLVSVSLLMCGMYCCAQSSLRILTVDEMFRLAEENSKAMKPYATAVAEADQAIETARNARLPEVSMQLSFSYLGDGTIMDREFTNITRADMPHFGNNFALEASQVIYTGGAITAGIKLAELAKQQAVLGQDQNRQQVRMLLIGQYLDLCKMYNNKKVYEKNIELTEKVIEDLNKRHEQGVVLRNDITRYELQLSNLQLVLTQICNTIDILNSNLCTYLGLKNTTLQPDHGLLNQSIPVTLKDAWTNEALEKSSSLRQLELAVDMSREQRKIINAERLPSIALVASDHFDGPITIEVPPINKNFNYWYVGVGMKYNLSSLYKTRKELRKSDFAIQKSCEQLENAREQTSIAMNEAYIKYNESYVEKAAQEKNVQLAQENYDVVRTRYDNGMSLITDMLDASNSLLTAQLQLENAKINIIFSYYKMKFIANTL